MTIEKLLTSAGLLSGILGSLLIFISFFIYLVKRNEYEKLLSHYMEKHELPAPYSFYRMVGFFGAFPVIRFFIRLSKKRRIFHLSQQDLAYAFFAEGNAKVYTWMKYFSLLWIIATMSYLCFGLAAALLYLYR